MLDAIDEVIAEKLHKLDIVQKTQVLAYIEQVERDRPKLTLAQWLERAEKSRAETSAKYGPDHIIDAQALIDEVREERLNDLMGGR